MFKSNSFALRTVLVEAVSFAGARVLSGILEIFLPEVMVNAGFDMKVFGIEGMAAKTVVSVAVIVLNYVFSKFIIFRK